VRFVYPVIEFALLTLVRLPISYWRDFVRERRWGLSTQSLGSWLADVVKAFAVAAVITDRPLFGLVAARALDGRVAARRTHRSHGLRRLLHVRRAGGAGADLHKFKPLEDQELAADLRGLSERCPVVPVRDVLVADASRRTTKSNAYVSGVRCHDGASVLYDTLLQHEAGGAQGRARHELAHRKHGDVARLSAILVAAAVGLVAAALVGPRRRGE
jgi:STE24 endopeptidase